MAQILVLEDNQEVARVLKAALFPHKLRVTETIVDFKSVLTGAGGEPPFRPDLMVLDIQLPDGSGLELYQSMIESSELREIPAIFLTAKGETSDKVIGLSLGVDDYVVKPFDPLELKARVELRLKKARRTPTEAPTSGRSTSKSAPNSNRYGDLDFDLEKMKVCTADGVEITLSALEFKLLLFLVKNEDRVVSRESVIEHVWGSGVHILDRTIDGHISNLRKKIRASTFLIKSVYGEGYRTTRFRPESGSTGSTGATESTESRASAERKKAS